MAPIEVENDPGFGLRSGQGQQPESYQMPDDGGEAVWGAAFRQTWFGRAIRSLRNSGSFAPEDGYNPLDDIKSWKDPTYLLDHGQAFVGSQSPGETQAIKDQIDQNDADRRLLAANGNFGIVAQAVWGLLDPINFFPGGVAVDAARGGLTFTKAATQMGKVGLLTSTAQDVLDRATGQTRPLSESALNVASGTLLTALIGGGAASMLGTAKRASLEAALHNDRAEMNAHAGNPVSPEAPPKTRSQDIYDAYERLKEKQDGFSTVGISDLIRETGLSRDEVHDWLLARTKAGEANIHHSSSVSDKRPEVQENAIRLPGFEEPFVTTVLKPAAAGAEAPRGTGQAVSAGAAAADTRELKPVSALGLEKLPLDPLSRVFSSSALPAKRAMAELADPPQIFEQTLRGEPTTLAGGPPVELQARLAIDQSRIKLADEIDRLYSEYRYGDQVAYPRARSTIEGWTGYGPQTKLSVEEFKHQAAIAAMSGDQHEIPQVEQAAQFWRQSLEPWAQRAENAIDGFQRQEFGEGQSYFPHLFDKPKIEAMRPEFTNIVTSHLAADQATKADAQVRIGAYQGALESHAENIEKLQGRISKLEEDADVIAARQEETTRFNKAANRRSELLRESQYRNDGGIRVDVPGKGIENARGGAVFETLARNRGNELADRASGKLAEIETLEQKLATEIADHDAIRTKIEDELLKWEGKSASGAKSALKARAKAEQARDEAIAAGTSKSKGERLTSADSAVDESVRSIMNSERDLSVEELRDKAHEIVNHILGSPAGRFNYDMATGGPKIGSIGTGEALRGSLHSRDFAIPTSLIRDFIETDIEHVNNQWLKTVIPDTLLAERFGDTEMTDVFRKIEDHYAQLTDTTKPHQERQKLANERNTVMRDVAAVRDRIRGVYGMDVSSFMPQAARVVAGIKAINVPISMGVSALSSLPDAAGSVFHYGFMSAFKDGYIPWLKSLMGAEGFKAVAHELKAMGIANETFLASRHHGISDIMDSFHPQSRLERTLQFGASRFQLVSLLAQWTDWAKTIAGSVAMANLLRATEKVANGTALSSRELRMLGESNITPQLAERIHKAWTGPEGGQIIDGVHWANSGNWSDKTAKDAFEGALARAVNMAVVTPGQEKPLLMSHPILNVLTQFQGYTAAAHQRILVSGLQRRDAQVLEGLLFSMGLGMLSYKLNSLTGGSPVSDKPQDWVKEAISRGNLLGWMEWGNALASKTTGGAVDIYRPLGAGKPMSRYASRSALDQLLGPTAGKVENILKMTSAIGRGDWNASDSKALRRSIAGQNLFWLRKGIDQVEAAGNAAFGIPMKESR